MTSVGNVIGRLAIAVCLIPGLFEGIMGLGYIETNFLYYLDDCSEVGGVCDALFSFCMGRASVTANFDDRSSCQYGFFTPGKDNYFSSHSIDMEYMSSIKGLSNPWRLTASEFYDYSIRLTIRVLDADDGNDDDMVVFVMDLSSSSWPSNQWLERTEHRADQGYNYLIHFKYRLYCEDGYYTRYCNTYCMPQNSVSGHYSCDQSNGSKICLKGWTGSNCNVDIDECVQGFCHAGQCQNQPGDVTCICPPLFTGKDCSQQMKMCCSTPCLNGGSCYMHPTDRNYTCTCTPDWQGENCHERADPCTRQPCLNNGTCISVNNRTSHLCDCTFEFTGLDCLTALNMSLGITGNNSTNSTLSVDQTKNEDSSGFKPWYGAIIVVVVVVIVVTLLLYIMIKRRVKNQPTTPTTASNNAIRKAMKICPTAWKTPVSHSSRIQCHPELKCTDESAGKKTAKASTCSQSECKESSSCSSNKVCNKDTLQVFYEVDNEKEDDRYTYPIVLQAKPTIEQRREPSRSPSDATPQGTDSDRMYESLHLNDTPSFIGGRQSFYN